MADGNPLIIGKANTETLGTSLNNLSAGDGYAFSVESSNVPAVRAVSDNSFGAIGTGKTVGTYGTSKAGVGVIGGSSSNPGVVGISSNSAGVFGIGPTVAVMGQGLDSSSGVVGVSPNKTGVQGESTESIGVFGTSQGVAGVLGLATKGSGVWAISEAGSGVLARSDTSNGVWGQSGSSQGVAGYSLTGPGVWGYSARGRAGYFLGKVEVQGKLIKGGGGFKIDHPLDPENNYLCHSFVESSEMKNIYDGVAVMDEAGQALVELPEWFGQLNDHFRYQLTSIGAAGPNLHIAEKINNNNRFKIGGGEPQMEVSWQVTGIRKDKWAKANQIEVEEEKTDEERGYYLHPELYDQPEELGIGRAEVQEQLQRVQQLEEQLRQEPLEVPRIDVASLQEEHRRQMEELGRRTEGQEQGEAPY